MINKENLNNMYEGIIKNQELTTKELNSYGFNSKDIANLVKNAILEKIRRGYYSFKSIEKLYFYGKELISMKEYDKATACFKKCYELDPKHSGACFQLFLRCIQNKDYEKAFQYFNRIGNSDNKFYNADSNYFLYLLSMITEIPENYREYAKYLKLEDIRVDFEDKRYNDIPTQNKVRLSSLNQKFELASKQLNNLIKQNGKLSVQDIIIRTLLNQAINEQKKKNRNIIKLINEKQYEEIIEYLEKLQKRHNLSLGDECILSLTKDLLDIIKTGQIPKKQIFLTDKLFDAIKGKNYELALQISSEYNLTRNITKDNAIYLLLNEIQKLVNKINKTPVTESQETKSTNTSKYTNSFTDVIKYLKKNDFDNSFLALKNYLDSIGKKQYEFLIISLIKISLLEGDITFTKPTLALMYIIRDNFGFNISEYIKNFYESLSLNKFDKAKIYLDIISNLNKLEHSCILTERLEQILYSAKKTLNYKENNEILNKVEQSIQNINQAPLYQKEQLVSKKQKMQSNNKDYDDNKFINQKLEKLYEKGILLLKPMDKERREGIHNIVKNIPNVVSFSIGTNKSRQIVLRYKPRIDEFLDVKELYKVGNEAYKNGDYDTCINSYRRLLEFGEPKAYIYAKLGLAYMKKFDKETAIDYLTVATELNKKENTEFDYTELIGSLKGIISVKNKKPRVKMSITDFKNDIDEHYGVEEVEQVAKLISSGMTFEDACLNIGLNEEQKNIVSLIFAKECYAQELYIKGDQFLKKVERSKNKTKFTKLLFEEVIRNKKFYKNRIGEEKKQLLLTQKIKK